MNRITCQHECPNCQFLLSVVRLFVEAECEEDLLWSFPSSGLSVMVRYVPESGKREISSLDCSAARLSVQCSDTFILACADYEAIKPEDLPLLEQCYEDAVAAGHEYYFGLLYASRKRGRWPLPRACASDFTQMLMALQVPNESSASS